MHATGNSTVEFEDLLQEARLAFLEHIRKMSATVIMVAHRLSTVESFDRIIMLENGKIAEEGTYSELMAKDGHFAQLVRKQLLQSTKKSFIS